MRNSVEANFALPQNLSMLSPNYLQPFPYTGALPMANRLLVKLQKLLLPFLKREGRPRMLVAASRMKKLASRPIRCQGMV